MNKYFLAIAIVLSQLNVLAQKKDKVLFKIDGEATYVSEFKSLFTPQKNTINKNEFQDDLQLMVDYKLKLKQVKLEKIDTIKKIKEELKKYKTELAKSHFTDEEALQNLVKATYDRTLYRVKASHILITPSKENDTIEAYKKAQDIVKQLEEGADFGALAVKHSDDPSAKKNKGDLGYFKPFQMVYDFENAAFNTPVGQIAPITKTQFGYHIVKVVDKVKAEGRVKVAHIMVAGLDAKNKTKIDSIYQLLQEGGDYEKLAKKLSDDKQSGRNGGVLNAFEKGTYPEPFEKIAFSMIEPDSYSHPFNTPYGWHIVKFIKKLPVASFDEMKSDLKVKVINNERGKRLKESSFEKLEATYNLVVNEEAKDVFKTDQPYSIPVDSLQNVLFTIRSKEYLQAGFSEYINNKRTKEPLSFFKGYRREMLKEYIVDRLGEDNDEFKSTIASYRNGLYIFELMKQHVWDIPSTQPEKVEAYYNAHLDSYKDKGETLEDVKGYVESDFQDEVQKEWIEALRNKSEIKYAKRQVKKLKKIYQ